MTSILRKKTTKIYIAIFVLGFLLIPNSTIKAQESLTLSVSPSFFDNMSVEPGQEWRSSLRVINVNPYDLTVYLDVVNFLPQGEGGQAQFIQITPEEPSGSTLAEWFIVNREAIVIPREQSKEIPITVRVPIDAAPGGHYAAVLVGTKPPQALPGQAQVQTSSMVSTLFFARVAGEINELGLIREFTTTEKYLNTPEATFELRFENKGNVHLQPQGEIRITNMWGQERGLIPINQNSQIGIVLRESIRKFTFSWKGEWSIADIGRYKAVVTLAHGSESRQFTTMETTFWLIPYKLLFGVLLVFSIFVTLITWLVRMYVRHMLVMAGIDINEYKNAKRTKTLALKYPNRKKLKLHRPVQEGILDLKQRLETAKTFLDSCRTVFKFIYHYKLFFIAVILILILTGSIIWYIKSATTSYRGYEVVYENHDTNVTLTSEEIIYERLKTERATEEPNYDKMLPKVSIVNRSGQPGLGAELKFRLESYGYKVTNLTADFSEIRSRTVLVASPNLQREALRLSTRLNNAPISTYAEENVEEEITVYVGSDVGDE